MTRFHTCHASLVCAWYIHVYTYTYIYISSVEFGYHAITCMYMGDIGSWIFFLISRWCVYFFWTWRLKNTCVICRCLSRQERVDEYTYTYMYVYIHIYVCILLYFVRVYVCVLVCVCVCKHKYIYMYTHIYTYIYIYTYLHIYIYRLWTHQISPARPSARS